VCVGERGTRDLSASASARGSQNRQPRWGCSSCAEPSLRGVEVSEWVSQRKRESE